MQRLRFALRVSLLMSIAALASLGAMGSASLAAGDAFDDDYTDCPSDTRIDAVSGLKVARTSEADELKVTWDMTNPSSWGLGDRYRAEIAVIVQTRGEDPEEKNLALGRNEVTFDEISFAEDLDISVAVVRDKYVISNIAVTEFTSGLAAPKFSSPFYTAKSDAKDIFREDMDEDFDADDNPRALVNLFDNDGKAIAARASVHKSGDKTSTFYYLGFNHGFDNWYADPQTRLASGNDANQRYPRIPKFRIGLRHGSDDPDDDPGDADFEHFRIRITDSSGDDALGFDAATVKDDDIYGGRVLILGNAQDESTGDAWIVDESNAPYFANIKRSNRVDDPTDAYYASSAAFWTRYTTGLIAAFPLGQQVRDRRPMLASITDATADLEYKLSSNNLLRMELVGGLDATLTPPNEHQRQLFALPPVEIYDMDPDVFSKDGNYTFEAWAEDDDGRQISPKAAITLNIREQFKGAAKSNLLRFKIETRPDGGELKSNRYEVITNRSVDSNAVVLGLSIFDD